MYTPMYHRSSIDKEQTVIMLHYYDEPMVQTVQKQKTGENVKIFLVDVIGL